MSELFGGAFTSELFRGALVGVIFVGVNIYIHLLLLFTGELFGSAFVGLLLILFGDAFVAVIFVDAFVGEYMSGYLEMNYLDMSRYTFVSNILYLYYIITI